MVNGNRSDSRQAPRYKVSDDDKGVEILCTPEEVTVESTPDRYIEDEHTSEPEVDTEDTQSPSFKDVKNDEEIILCSTCDFEERNVAVSVCAGDICPDCQSSWLRKK